MRSNYESILQRGRASVGRARAAVRAAHIDAAAAAGWYASGDVDGDGRGIDARIVDAAAAARVAGIVESDAAELEVLIEGEGGCVEHMRRLIAHAEAVAYTCERLAEIAAAAREEVVRT